MFLCIHFNWCYHDDSVPCFENVGMSVGLLPLTGIPLPFVSAGGSALIGNMIGIGLIMSMQYHNKSYMFGEDKEFS